MSSEDYHLVLSGSQSVWNARRVQRKVTNYVILSLTGLLTLLALIPLFWIIGYVVYKGGQYISLSFFTQLPRPLGIEGGGVLHAIEGTLLLTLLSSLIAIPPAILAAIYTAYNPKTPLGIAVRFSTDVLAGVPSVVVGLFIYAVVVVPQGHYSAFAGGIALAILMFPVILRTTEEMIKLVPAHLRQAGLALGSAEWRTMLSITLPAASNGIITGILLGVARASGETAPLLFTALGNEHYEFGRIISNGIQGRQGIFTVLNNIFEQPVDSLPLTLWKYAQQPYPERVNQAWAVALVLMILVLLVNIVTRLWIQARMRKMTGK